MQKAIDILTNIATVIIGLLVIAILIGIILIVAGLVWTGVLSIWNALL